MKPDDKTTALKGATKANGKSVLRRGNILDLLILLLLVAAIISIGYRYYTKSRPARTDELREAEIAFEIKDAIFTLPSYVKTGDTLYFEDGTVFGTVLNNSSEEENTALYVQGASVVTTDESGNFVRVTYPDLSRVDAQGKLRCRVTPEADGSVLLEGNRYITPGSAVRVHTETATFYITVVSVTVTSTN
jgi:hypothetical protein